MLSDGQLRWDGDQVEARDATFARRFDTAARGWIDLPVSFPGQPVEVAARLLRAEREVPADYGFGGARHRAPSHAAFDALAAVYALEMPAWSGDALLDIDWAGDVAQLRVDGETVDDRFWDGTRWSVSLRDVGVQHDSTVTLHLLALSGESTVWLPPAAEARRRGTAAALLALDRVSLRERGEWMPVDTGR
ncbi:hypothetical protein [Microbacterium sp. NPDC058345]|uniref:hypothetical protein n=1 Tax=Microbacterium sp. NPDC058345 TaxID=3346455 RepID=UPI00364A19EF